MRSWIHAFRLRTLPLAFSGWLVGTTLAGNQIVLDYTIASLTLFTAILLQILSNLANDYGDATSGVDEHRTGEARMVSSGRITPGAMKNAMIVFTVLSLTSGLILLYLAFPKDFMSALIFFVIGLVGIAAAIKYTVGKNPYGYVGFGDVFVFAFFGIVLVFGSFYLQTKMLDLQILLPAASIGLFSVGVLNVNNIRDIESDRSAGKQSIPVRIGKSNAVAYHQFLLIGGMLLSVLFVALNYQSWTGFVFIVVILPIIANIKAVAKKPSSQLDPYLKQMALSTLLFALLFSAGQVLAYFF